MIKLDCYSTKFLDFPLILRTRNIVFLLNTFSLNLVTEDQAILLALMNNINEAVVLAEEKQEQLKHYFDSQVYIRCFIYTELLQIIYRLKIRLALYTHCQKLCALL